MATIFSKAIPSVLFIAGAIDKGTFSAVEVFKAIKQYQHGDVVPVLDTLSILTNGKFAPLRNKQGAKNLRENVTPHTQNAKSKFKQLGACLALLDLIDQDASEENGYMFAELCKQYSTELKTAYEATKQPKAAKTATVEPVTAMESTPVDDTSSDTTGGTDISVNMAYAATVKAIQAGLLDAAQLTELRMVLAELPAIEASQLSLTH